MNYIREQPYDFLFDRPVDRILPSIRYSFNKLLSAFVILIRRIFNASEYFDYYKEIFNLVLPSIFGSWQVYLAITAKLA
jgi:hypothetical protein